MAGKFSMTGLNLYDITTKVFLVMKRMVEVVCTPGSVSDSE